VFSLEGIAGEPVIELFLGWLPVNQLKVFAVVLEMATDAVLAIGVGHLETGVITVAGGDALSDFLVAVEALEGRRACAKLMATCALRRARERLVRFRERAGRDLRLCNSRREEGDEKEKESISQPR
jgi:hypothetical protein